MLSPGRSGQVPVLCVVNPGQAPNCVRGALLKVFVQGRVSRGQGTQMCVLDFGICPCYFSFLNYMKTIL